ncbi:MAG: hypothetical protein J2P28_19945, partial [Actinobacteria bacterium]|nr:hypothetical protein [Actinomycetota bacterium]
MSGTYAAITQSDRGERAVRTPDRRIGAINPCSQHERIVWLLHAATTVSGLLRVATIYPAVPG